VSGKRKYDRRTLTAYHEAGHALVAFDQGVRIYGVNVTPDRERRGNIRIDTLHLNRLIPTFEHDKGARNRFIMERHVMVLLGGNAAVCRLDPSRKTNTRTVPGEGSDFLTAQRLVGYFTGSKIESEKYLDWLAVRVEGIIRTPWRWYQLKKVAQALLENEKLGPRKVREIIKEAGQEWMEKQGNGESENRRTL